MSIKSDHWIRRMAQSHGLIAPFEAGQVRQNEKGRIISYGTSSYGYDVRCAREFKIFTNINSTIVDPKQFDEKSFVDVSADVCIIPPNSFALARTVEYFKIPRNVLTVCLGKCVTGDTRVVDADTGAYVPISEMRFGRRTLALENWHLAPAKVSAFIPQGEKEVFELRTRAGLRIRATANHPFRMLEGWRSLSDLRVGDRIATAREIPVFGKTPIPDWEATLLGLMVAEGQCDTPGHSPTYTSDDPVLVTLLQQAVEASGLGEITYKQRYGYRLVNRKGRGVIAEHNRAHLWLKRHKLNVGAAAKFVPQSVFTSPESSVRLFLQALFSGDGGIYCSDAGVFVEYYSNSRRLIDDVHHLLLRFGIVSLIREKTTSIGTTACKIQITDKEQVRRFAERIGLPTGSLKQRRLESLLVPLINAQPRRKSNFDTLPREAWAFLGASARSAGRSLSSLGVHTSTQSVSYSVARTVAAVAANSEISALIEGPLWDVVESIERAGVEQVFDITVPGPHNFVANDLIVHNSTYARCFSGDTEVALTDGSAVTLEEMARAVDSGKEYEGYGIGADGRIVPSILEYPRFIARDALLEITLDNHRAIRATADHKFWRRDGQRVAAAALRSGDSLMPLYRSDGTQERSIYQAFQAYKACAHSGHGQLLNHKVLSVRELAGVHDVYCLTVPGAGNFALDAGVFVDNCGIIVNVTPLEPEWEGHVTLEFSNTTPLPAKIYANEGVAQMLFFESDEVCDVSYADRGGKYQGQRGVTLPKA